MRQEARLACILDREAGTALVRRSMSWRLADGYPESRELSVNRDVQTRTFHVELDYICLENDMKMASLASMCRCPERGSRGPSKRAAAKRPGRTLQTAHSVYKALRRRTVYAPLTKRGGEGECCALWWWQQKSSISFGASNASVSAAVRQTTNTHAVKHLPRLASKE